MCGAPPPGSFKIRLKIRVPWPPLGPHFQRFSQCKIILRRNWRVRMGPRGSPIRVPWRCCWDPRVLLGPQRCHGVPRWAHGDPKVRTKGAPKYGTSEATIGAQRCRSELSPMEIRHSFFVIQKKIKKLIF